MNFLEDLLPWAEKLPKKVTRELKYGQRGSIIRSPAFYSGKVITTSLVFLYHIRHLYGGANQVRSPLILLVHQEITNGTV